MLKVFLICVLAGFVAQFIDGMAGMAYGVSCKSFLRLFLRLSSVLCSAIVHIAEIPLSFVSGISHLAMKNVDNKLLLLLTIPGVVGAVLGAVFVTYIDAKIEIMFDIYLLLMGIRTFSQAFSKRDVYLKDTPAWTKSTIALFGGFFDASGGGGWGPIVTTSLISSTDKPQKVIGTVNTAEFVVTAVQVLVFGIFLTSVNEYAHIIIAIILGGIVAAPISAKLCTKMERKYILLAVGVLLVIVNLFNIIAYFKPF